MMKLSEINPTPFVVNTEHPGSRDAVKTLVDTKLQNGINGKPEGADQSLADLTKTIIKGAVDLLPEDFNATVVRADCRYTGQGIRIVVNVDGAKTL